MAHLDLSLLLQGATLAALLWLVRTFLAVRDEVLSLRLLLTGEDGQNGVRGDVKELKLADHRRSNAIHALNAKADLHELRINAIEEKIA